MVRGNSDDSLVNLAMGGELGFNEPAALLDRGRWSVERLGPARIERLSRLPMQ